MRWGLVVVGFGFRDAIRLCLYWLWLTTQPVWLLEGIRWPLVKLVDDTAAALRWFWLGTARPGMAGSTLHGGAGLAGLGMAWLGEARRGLF